MASHSPSHSDPAHHDPDAPHAAKAPKEGELPNQGPPVQTVADEQRARSEEVQKEGQDKWMAEHNPRPEGEAEQPKVVPGVRNVHPSEVEGSKR
jgi:hypothetical protein